MHPTFALGGFSLVSEFGCCGSDRLCGDGGFVIVGEMFGFVPSSFSLQLGWWLVEPNTVIGTILTVLSLERSFWSTRAPPNGQARSHTHINT